MLIAMAGLNDNVAVQFKVQALESAWADFASSDGIVYKNVTAS